MTKTTPEEYEWKPGEIQFVEDKFAMGVRQAAKVAKAAYMLKHNDPEAASLLEEVILSPLVKDVING